MIKNFMYDDIYILRALKGKYHREESISVSAIDKLILFVMNTGMLLAFIILYPFCVIPLVSSFFETFVRTFSRGTLGFFLRGAYYKTKLKRMGKNVFIDVGVIIWEPQNVEIGDNTFIDTYVTILGGWQNHGFVRLGEYVEIASNSVLAGRGGITLGDHVGIGSGTAIYSGTHLYKNPDTEDTRLLSGSILAPLEMQYVVEKPVTIHDFGWIGSKCTIMPGVHIGKGAVVGSNSVVNNDIPEFSVAVGAPAKVIKTRPKIS